MITYQPLWETMKAKGISTYALIEKHGVSRETFSNLKNNRNITMSTLNHLCELLNCDVTDVIKYTPDNPTISDQNNQSTDSNK